MNQESHNATGEHPDGAPADSADTPFANLHPETILDALELAGFEPNGSLLALNSFENRVYQAGLHDGSFVVTKFYRPNRWSREQILEEHAFTQELLAAELSVVAPLTGNGTSLFDHDGFQFAVFPRQGGHPPEIESEHNLAIMGRTLGRLHAVGCANEHRTRPALDWRRMAQESRDWLLASTFIPAELLPAYESVTEHLLEGIERAMDRPLQSIRLHGDCHLGNVLWRDDVPHFVDFDDTVSGARDSGSVDAALGRSAGPQPPVTGVAGSLRDLYPIQPRRAGHHRGAAYDAHDAPRRLDRAPLE